MATPLSHARVTPPLDRIKALLLIGFMFLPVKVTIPTGAPVHPNVDTNRETFLVNWSKARNELLLTVERIRSVNISQPLWFAIWYPVDEYKHCYLFRCRTYRPHRYQLKRVIHSSV